MKVELIHNTPLWVASKAIRKCWASEDKSDTEICNYGDQEGVVTHIGEKDKALNDRVGNKNKHKSTLEHLVYTFDIDGISRACLQEVARHRMASYSVKSTRYTLKELTQSYKTMEAEAWIKFAYSLFVSTGNANVDGVIYEQLENLCREENVSNDIAKYMLPEAYKTSLVMTINARSLQNFLELRTDKSALWEIRDLANAMYQALPNEHKYLFEEYVKVI